MHKKVNTLLHAIGDKVCVQYIFSSFGNQFDKSGLYLIEVYLTNNKSITEAAYAEWFTTGRSNKEKFFKKYNIDITNKTIIEEYANHKKWKDTTKLSATPTILVNGYKLPSNYKIEDLIYFTDII